MNTDRIVFVNPHRHHSFFTVLGLSRNCHVEFLCPPLAIDLFFNKWNRSGLQIKTSFVGTLIQSSAFLFFLLFKVKILSLERYHFLFTLISTIYLSRHDNAIVYCYQDYLLPLIKKRSSSLYFICEYIIQFPLSQSNYASSVEVSLLADMLVAPTSFIKKDLKTDSVIIAPYGGDKLLYFKRRKTTKNSLNAKKSSTVIVRANSHRKGLDIFINSLRLILTDRPKLVNAEFIIAGAVDTQFVPELLELRASLLKYRNIKLQWGELSEEEYQEHLFNASVFLMPTRLEGSSPAAIEALWHGIPCILSVFAGVENFEDERHGWLISDLSNLELLTEMILKSLTENSVTDKIRANLEQDRYLFTWSQYLQVLSSVNIQIQKSNTKT
jgi:glycosyltransferase involved in cell wall biosynthesis